MSNATTLEGTGSRASDGDHAPTRLALVLLWSATEHARVGEVLLPPTVAHKPAVFGRGDAADDGEPRVGLVRQRPGANEPTEPLENPFLSRRQLRLGVEGDAVAIESLGKRPLVGEAGEVERALVREGETVEIKSQLLFLCVRRPAKLAALQHPPEGKLHPFGEADAHGVVGETPLAWELRDQVALVAGLSPHVLLLGESGAGKELVARAVHALSARRAKKLVARNAATFPAGLIDAELFGNVANYPNPGMPERPGLVGEADGGTLFLDEIGELPVELQSHLLRVLDAHGEYQRLGDARRRTSDLRLVAATNRPVADLKHDLAARLALRVTIPGLNERREDVPLLARHLLRAQARKDPQIGTRFFASWTGREGEPRIAAPLARALTLHRYATHARELEGLLWRSLTTSKGASLELTDAVTAEIAVARPVRSVAPQEVTAEQIREALARHAGVREKVWRELGMANRHVLQRLMKKYGIAGEAEGEEG